MLSGPTTIARRAVARFVPGGAITLAVLSLAYFAMGLIRNRVFANAFGAGPELDAYNAAFRIPEIALDILVASGLSAPFVPIFSRLRGEPGGAARAETFGRSVLTAAMAVMAVSRRSNSASAGAIEGAVMVGTRQRAVQVARRTRPAISCRWRSRCRWPGSSPGRR